MDSGTGSTLFPLHRCKTLHLVPHMSFHRALLQLFLLCKEKNTNSCSITGLLFFFFFNFVVNQVRHAQGIHNVEGEKDHKAYLSPKLFDAHLTPLGWQQVRALLVSYS